MPTWLGETVNEVMNKHFPDIVDTGFTADMERQLDEVEEGRRSWTAFLHNFYGNFKTTMEKAEAEMDRVQKPIEEIDEKCPECGRNLVIRTGRFGRFISCSGFPECKYRRSFMNKTGALCPVCGGDLVERKTRQKKRIFYGCANYPTCNFAIWERPVADPCPRCGGLMVVPKNGQEPVCYEEVIVPQRDAADIPQQGESTGKKKAALRTTKAASNGAKARATRGTRRASTARSARKATTVRKGRTTTRRATTTAVATSEKRPAAKATSPRKNGTKAAQ
jgi:DNA topoisomerase-1